MFRPNTTAIPQFPSRDLAKTRRFYEALSFSCSLHLTEPDPFLIMTSGRVELHFWQNQDLDPTRSNHSCYLRFTGAVEAWDVFDRWCRLGLPEAGIPRLQRPEERAWGMTEFYLVDLDGLLLKCGFVTKGS